MPVFSAMKPGDSFACDAAVAKRLMAAATTWGKPLQRVFALRQMTADTARIWRTK